MSRFGSCSSTFLRELIVEKFGKITIDFLVNETVLELSWERVSALEASVPGFWVAFGVYPKR